MASGSAPVPHADRPASSGQHARHTRHTDWRGTGSGRRMGAWWPPTQQQLRRAAGVRGSCPLALLRVPLLRVVLHATTHVGTEPWPSFGSAVNAVQAPSRCAGAGPRRECVHSCMHGREGCIYFPCACCMLRFTSSCRCTYACMMHACTRVKLDDSLMTVSSPPSCRSPEGPGHRPAPSQLAAPSRVSACTHRHAQHTARVKCLPANWRVPVTVADSANGAYHWRGLGGQAEQAVFGFERSGLFAQNILGAQEAFKPLQHTFVHTKPPGLFAIESQPGSRIVLSAKLPSIHGFPGRPRTLP